jgi:hypothetical protein
VNKQKTTTNQVVETRDRRIAKSIVVAYSCEITKLDNEKETYKVQSETDVSKFYVVKFVDKCPVFCQCADFLHRIKSNPNHICKHARAIVLAEQYGLIKTEKQEDEYTF